MKRRFTLPAAVIMLLCSISLFAQDRTITGKVIADDGSILPGVSITVRGTTRGATTDSEGSYKIAVPTGSQLVFSFIGFTNQEVTVGTQNVIDVRLMPDATQLQEVVVTALGIPRDKKALNYSVQEIKGDKITAARDPNVANALAGKIAGVQVLGQSAAKFGTPNIRIRGVNSLTGGDPLYVVDGTPTDISQVNMDDVESLSVLKGPSATALYGNRASGGVVVITTKKAKSGEAKLDINHSTTLDMIGMLPKYQNEYGGGYSQDWETFSFNPAIHPADWKSFDGQKILDYSADESWGPKIDGSPHRSAFSWQQGPEFGQLTPYSAQPNNVRDFFNKPISNNTNIAFSKGGENFQARVSYTHISTNGIIPNSKQSKDFLSAKNTITLLKNLTANLNINYTSTRGTNVPADNYGSSGGVLGGFNQTIGSFNQWFQRQLRIEDLKNYKNPDGTFRSWNIGGPLDPKPKYWDSPYTQMYESTNSRLDTRLFGDFGLTYQFSKYLKGSVTARRDQRQYNQQGRVAYGTLNAGGLGAFANYVENSRENNYEGLLSFDKTFGELSVVANAGGNIRYNLVETYSQATSGGLTSPGFYNIAASKDRPAISNNRFERRVNSLYGNVSLGYKDIVFLEASLRNDWSSTLPVANNSYLYPSLSGGVILTELLPRNPILSYAKVRAGYAQVGTDVGPYQIFQTYTTGNAFGSNATQYLPTLLPNADLKPGLSSSYEAGLDMKFMNNRFGVEFTWYQNDNKNQIIPLPVDPTSGYRNAIINAGLIQTKGLELHIFANPVKSERGFNWDFDINLDRNRSKVIKLADGLTNYQLGGPTWRTLTVNAREGEDWGLLVGKKIRTLDGKRVVDANGFYIVDDQKSLGSVLPTFKGGFLNSFTYRNLSLRVNTDFIVGGRFFSTTRMFNAYAGLAAETAGLNELGNPKRDPVSKGGGVLLDAVTQDGKPNTTRVETQELYEDKFFALNDQWTYDQTYVKLREVALGYNLPKSLLSRVKVKSANISFIVRNPLLIYSAVGGGLDISESETFWTEGGQLPPVRSFGLNLRLSL
ncbi:SusC/RagA family TonB-linked outer membrane protein [Runella sp. CRIBMP]|uniref:SusC/RagA family TonB-linked outer membrane protein n=1 Tax=Runella sp. CRIBMP TaxID=2683261 RepID=UPI001412CDD8|nr:SusC/RagA family TonB-linked outer membrane protein [Runella sp. CRIBMP]NBB18148.1 SusC/RagA family TonB-linked outer membrane protein [Runella sp. CRIBMP]